MVITTLSGPCLTVNLYQGVTARMITLDEVPLTTGSYGPAITSASLTPRFLTGVATQCPGKVVR